MFFSFLSCFVHIVWCLGQFCFFSTRVWYMSTWCFNVLFILWAVIFCSFFIQQSCDKHLYVTHTHIYIYSVLLNVLMEQLRNAPTQARARKYTQTHKHKNTYTLGGTRRCRSLSPELLWKSFEKWKIEGTYPLPSRAASLLEGPG